jgi:hypothetical protein
MEHVFSLFDRSSKLYAVYSPEVMRLSAGLRIKMGLLEYDGWTVGDLDPTEDLPLELKDVRIVVIKPLSHR